VPVMPEEPRPHKNATLAQAITRTEKELNRMFAMYAADPSLQLMHPIFGELNYELQIRYMDKHLRHHLRQFGLIE